MKIIDKELSFTTKGFTDIIEITADIRALLKESKLRSGIIRNYHFINNGI